MTHPPPWRSIGLALACGSCTTSCLEGSVLYGEMLDGRGIGLFERNQISLVPSVVTLIACALAIRLWRQTPGPFHAVAVVAAIAFPVLFVATSMPHRLFVWSWSFRCARGESLACTGAAWLHQEGLGVAADQERAASLLRDDCARGAIRSCNNLLWIRPDDPLACGVAAGRCADASANEEQREISCRVLVRGCLPNLERPVNARFQD